MRPLSKASAVLVLLCATLAAATTGSAAAPTKSNSTRAISVPLITSASEVGQTSAKLSGTVLAVLSTSYKFEYGTTGFTQSTAPQTAGIIGSLAVSRTVVGLQPGTTYMWRLVAGGTPSATGYFTTGAPGTASGGSDGLSVFDAINTSNPTPQAGDAIVVDPSSSIEIKLPGSSTFVSLGSTASIPTGSVIRTGREEIALTSIDDAGRPQTGYFWGGTFRIDQKPDGFVVLTLVSDFRACAKRAKTRGASASSTKARKGNKNTRAGSLWGRDKGGKFRTKGRSSVATVRGTRWYTEDRCGGTYTKVTEGAVSVKPKRGKVKVVKAGKSFFAAK